MNTETPLSAQPRPLDFAPIAVVAFIGILLAAVVFALLRSHFETVERQRFQRDAASVSASFTASVERHIKSLEAISAFVSASRNVTRWEFAAFAEQTLPGNPGFPAFFWVPSVPAAQRERYETGLQRDGLYGLGIRDLGADGQLLTAGARTTYRPVSYVEPFGSSAVAVGLDLSPLPEFKALFETAEKTGQVAVSSPIERSVLDEEPGPAVIVAFPFIDETAKTVPGTPKGYAIGVLKFERVLNAIVPKGSAPVEIAIAYNEPAFARKIVYSSIGNPAASRNINEWMSKSVFAQAVPFTVAGQQFMLGLRSPAASAPFQGLLEPAGAALLVLALAALLGQHLYSSIAAKHAVERAVLRRTAQLQHANEALQAEIAQRRAAEAELRAAKDRAEGANRAKSEFLATMSHELRTPLNAIIGFSSMLSTDAVGPIGEARARDYVKLINEGGIRLLGLINDLLDLSQMDAGRAELDEDIVHLPTLVEDALAKAGAKAEAAGVSLRTSCAEGLPALRADERRLQKALSCLLSNAVKFTPKGGTAEIALSKEADGTIAIAVSDTGVGIPKGQEERVLEPFVQLDSTLARSHEGAGLGLAFVKRVAQLHDAALAIESEPGQGTSVTMRFPARRAVKSVEVA